MSRLMSRSILARAAIAPTNEVPVSAPVTWKGVRALLDGIAARSGEWGGAPIPVDHVSLRLEPRYPYQRLNGVRLVDGEVVSDAVSRDEEDYHVVNRWHCFHRGSEVVICRDADGLSRGYLIPDGAGRRLEYWLNTLGVASQHAWDIDVESRAVEKLASLVNPHALHCYQLAGGFLETSRKSHVTYLFRKLRPTLALRPDRRDNMQVIAVLCMHPLGYYADSWAGVMCPTDDVIAHLMLMRGDEHRFWKKSNHHPMSAASAGI